MLKAIHSVLATLAVAVILGGCAAPPIVLDALPTFRAEPLREVPQSEFIEISANVPQQVTMPDRLKSGVTARRDLVVAQNARVVISVPVEEQQREARRKTQMPEKEMPSDNIGITSFKTTGYFNKAEQQIETSLIGKDFTVIDRAKFEAKLRNERRSAGNESAELNEDKEAEVAALLEKKDSGRISLDGWAEELKAIERKYKSGIKGRKADTPELADTSELIRAAQSGETQADYILRVNAFKTGPLSDTIIDFLGFPSVSEVCAKHRGLAQAITQADLARFTQPGFYGLLNAKLIEVQTGSIVWVGSHRVDSRYVLETGLHMRLRVEKSVSNSEAIHSAVRAHNTKLQSILSSCKSAKAKVSNQALPREQRENAAERYRDLCSQYDLLRQEGPPAAARARWEYSYSIEPMQVLPVMPTETTLELLQQEFGGLTDPKLRRGIRQKARSHQEFLNLHYSKLAKLVAKELIGTIPTENAR